MEVRELFPRSVLQQIVGEQTLFPMVKVAQKLPSEFIAPCDLPAQVCTALRTETELIRPHMRIGITVGSRGIDRLDTVLRVLVQEIKKRGAEAFLVPCMGSHGVNADGQREVLAGLGITEESVGAEIISHDEVVKIPACAGGRTAYMDRSLYECDGIIVLNRVKAHTAFHGRVESGLCKMMAVGMGKQMGAAACHRHGFQNMCETVTDTAASILATGKILFGVALLENAYGQLCYLEAVPAGRIMDREPELLWQAKKYMPSLPFGRLDLLIVDEMGKDISGSGMDTNVIGRYPVAGITGGPRIDQIVALSLTAASEGSGHGMGFADFISARLFAALDLEKTYINGLTNRTSGPAKIPPVMPSDRTAIQAAVRSCALEDISAIRAVRIRNTHDLEELYVSPALLGSATRPLEIRGEAQPMCFDGEGNLAGW